MVRTRSFYTRAGPVPQRIRRIRVPTRLGVDGWFHRPTRNARFRQAGSALFAATSVAAAAAYGGYRLYKRFTRSSSSPSTALVTMRRKRMPVRRTRTTYRRKRKFTGRKSKRRGTRYTGWGKRGKKLNANFSRNDRRSLRVCEKLGSFIINDAALATNNVRYNCDLNAFLPQFIREVDSYEQFKFSNVQFVIVPRNFMTGNSTSVVDVNQIPFLAMRTVHSDTSVDPIINFDELRNTPGVRYIKIQKKSRTVQNVKPMVTVQNTMVDLTVGSPFTIKRAMPWMDINSFSKAHKFASIEISGPKLLAGSDEFNFDVNVYATILLRGNKTELVPPY